MATAAMKRPGIRKSMIRQSMLLTKDQLDDMRGVFNTVCQSTSFTVLRYVMLVG